MLINLIKEDPNFNEDMFKTNINNMFIMLLSSIMTDKLDRVRHFLSTDLEEKYDELLESLNSNNERQMYDELNVAGTTIEEVTETNDSFIVKIKLTSRYMDYVVNKISGDYLRGVNDHRIEKINYLTLKKNKKVKDNKIARKCPGCGANISVNTSGKCNYCGAIYDQENYDWVITNIETTI